MSVSIIPAVQLRYSCETESTSLYEKNIEALCGSVWRIWNMLEQRNEFWRQSILVQSRMGLNSGSRKDKYVLSQDVNDKAAGENRQPGKCLHTDLHPFRAHLCYSCSNQYLLTLNCTHTQIIHHLPITSAPLCHETIIVLVSFDLFLFLPRVVTSFPLSSVTGIMLSWRQQSNRD